MSAAAPAVTTVTVLYRTTHDRGVHIINRVAVPAARRMLDAWAQGTGELQILAVRGGVTPEGVERRPVVVKVPWAEVTYLDFEPTRPACARVGSHNCDGTWRNHDRADDQPFAPAIGGAR
ncbi:hypothetical protein [Actinoplanes sp. URMC 104]|uniref:hypothetical protein n=1 Tax=Actinoplanes sp. URMC 104 TaxID=3423409 RepID=UPI003F1C591F